MMMGLLSFQIYSLILNSKILIIFENLLFVEHADEKTYNADLQIPF